MQSISTSGADAAPFSNFHRRRRLLGRVKVSDALAGALADLAYSAEGRDDAMLLAGLVAERCAAAGVGVGR